MREEDGETVKHILSDGTELESIEGLTVPATGTTEAVYRIIADFIKGFGEPEREAGRCQVQTH